RTLHQSRQKATVAVSDGRILELHRAYFQDCFGEFSVGGQAQFREVVCSGITVTRKELASVTITPAARIQLHAQQANGVHTKANSAFRIARLYAKQEALCPLLLFGLCSTILTEITIEIEVTQFQISFRIFKKSSLSHGWDGQCCSQSGQGHAPGDGGLEHFLFSSLDDALKSLFTALCN